MVPHCNHETCLSLLYVPLAVNHHGMVHELPTQQIVQFHLPRKRLQFAKLEVDKYACPPCMRTEHLVVARQARTVSAVRSQYHSKM